VRFYRECTPGYYNNEGQEGNPNSWNTFTYGAGPIAFFDLLREWRDADTFPGMVLS
jgi:cyclohexanone monooxygenase